jgi:hypothetical protein
MKTLNKTQNKQNHFQHESILYLPKNTKKIVTNHVKIGKISPNIDLLKILISYQSPSFSDQLDEFIYWLIGYVSDNYSDCIIETDDIGNIYITKGSSEIFPCIVAHTDINQQYHPKVCLKEHDDILFGWDYANHCQVGPGFDDKIGILIALQALEHFDNLKVFFPINEEVGYVGSRNACMEWFNDVGYCIQPDRNSYNNDFITYTNGVDVCSEEFVNVCSYLLTKYSYKTNKGLGTDIGELKIDGLDCSAVNISCGYFNEHSNKEVCSISALHNCLNLIIEMISYLGETKFEHKVEFEDTYIDNCNYGKWDDWEENVWKSTKPKISKIWKSDTYALSKHDEKYLNDLQCPICINTLLLVGHFDNEYLCEWCNAKFYNG